MAGSDPGRDVLGLQGLGRKTPVSDWSTSELLEVLDKLAQHHGTRFTEVLQYRQALASASDRAALKEVLMSAYHDGRSKLKQHGPLPKGFLTSVRFCAEQEGFDLSEFVASTNAAVQRAVLTSLCSRGASELEIKGLVQNFDNLDRRSKHMALSILLKAQTPEVEAFLNQVDDPAISNRVRSEGWGRSWK